MRTRRTLLAQATTLLGAGALAGCLGGPSGPGTDDEPPDGTPDDHTDDCTSGFSVTADAFAPTEDLLLALEGPEQALVEDALAEGPVTVERYSAQDPLPDGAYVERDGAYHELSVAEGETTEIPAVLLDVAWEDGQTAPADATAVQFADLPAVDREALGYALDGDSFGGESEGHPSESLSIQQFPAPYPDGTDDSALVGAGETWVRRDGRTYSVTADGRTTTDRHEFEVDLEMVAETDEAFRTHVDERYRVSLEDRSEPAKDVVRQAAADGYQECDPASDGLAELRDRLPQDRLLPHPENNAWYVTLDGEGYALTILNWLH